MVKIYVQDIVAKMAGQPETELPEGTTIRFEIDGMTFEVSADQKAGRLIIRKSTRAGFKRDEIAVHPANTNSIEIA